MGREGGRKEGRKIGRKEGRDGKERNTEGRERTGVCKVGRKDWKAGLKEGLNDLEGREEKE